MDCHRHPDNCIIFRHSRSVCNRARSFHANRCRRCETHFPGGCRRRKGASFRSHRNREYRRHDFAGIEGSRRAEGKAARCLEKPWQNSRDDPGTEPRRRRRSRSSGESKVSGGLSIARRYTWCRRKNAADTGRRPAAPDVERHRLHRGTVQQFLVLWYRRIRRHIRMVPDIGVCSAIQYRAARPPRIQVSGIRK